jgi:hypothetical protein
VPAPPRPATLGNRQEDGHAGMGLRHFAAITIATRSRRRVNASSVRTSGNGCRRRDSGGEDRVTFVWSAPNRLPLPERAVRRAVEAVRPYRLDRIYGGWWQPVLRAGASEILEASASRYIEFINGDAAVD